MRAVNFGTERDNRRVQIEPLVLVDRSHDGRVVHVTLNRPARRNSLTGPLATELADAIEAVNADSAASVVVLAGAGGAFCSGLDLQEFNADPQPDWVPRFGHEWRRAHRALFDCDKIVVVALERYAINGGAGLANAADFLIAGETAWVQVGEIQQGMAAPMNMAWLRLRHSEAVAARVALIGDRLTGPTLLQLGLAHEVVADDEVLSAARDLAGRLAEHDVTGVHRIKTSMRRTGIDVDAAEWFERAHHADPLVGRPIRPVAAEDR